MNGVFDAYARYYDLLYRDKDYSTEANYIAEQVRRHDLQATSILELGCGTGGHAEHLAQQGFSIDGLDLSEAMVDRARARQAALPAAVADRLSFATGDMRRARTGKTYDVVISLFHVMSYQTSNADLHAVFSTAAAHLAPGGLFLFDFWYGPAVLTVQPEVRVRRLEDDAIRVTRIAEPFMHPNRNVVDVNYAVFVEDKNSGAVHELRETHPMRYLFLPELSLLADPGFSANGNYGWMTNNPPDAGTWAAISLMSRV